MKQWKDTTSYPRGERGSVEPRILDLDLDGLRVTVHRIHGIDDQWFGTCRAMGVKDRELTSNLRESQLAFLGYLKARAWNWADKLAAAEAA